MIKVGQKVRLNKFHYEYGSDHGGNPEDMVVGEVILVNKPHRYFTAEYKAADRKWTISFNFNDLAGVGRDGRAQIVG